jgi:hypothetical protein
MEGFEKFADLGPFYMRGGGEIFSLTQSTTPAQDSGTGEHFQ